MATSDYGQSSITSLKGADRVRKRPGVIFGSADINGTIHSVFEIISNSVDEGKEGYGNVINIAVRNDNSIVIEDFGRGMPLDWNPGEERYNWELIFCELYAGGKYGEDEGGNYNESIGLNGLGACATQYASEYMKVTAYRQGIEYFIEFKKGQVVTGELVKKPSNSDRTGTIIEFKPDLEVFDDINIPMEILVDMLRRQAMLTSKIKFNLKYKDHNVIPFFYPNGTSEFIDELVGRDKITREVIVGNVDRRGNDGAGKQDYNVNIDIALTFSRHHQLVELYHNSSPLDNDSKIGIHVKSIRSALVKVFTDLFKDNKEYKNIGKLKHTDIEDILVCIVSTKSLGSLTQYENQTKKAVTNKFIGEALQSYIYDFVMEWSVINETECERLLKEISINKKAREGAEAAKSKALKTLSSSIDNNTKRPKKFVDCDCKDIEQREIYIVEGDSALGACKLARDGYFQGIMPVRGKIRNCIKSGMVDIFKSDPIMDLIKVLGCGIETNDKNFKDAVNFDLKKLRWGKVIICTDADIDGMQIRTLILTMFYRLMPQVLEAGLVYIAETPLFEIEYKKQTYFAFDENEKISILEKLGNPTSGVKLQRSKGLGENEPEMMNLTTMNPATRRLIQVKYDRNDNTMNFIFNALLGDDIENRKILISDFAAEVDAYGLD